MGITERREREKAGRRKAILDCAKDLILSQGVQISIEDIALKAELSKATVYLYFSGKDDLFNEICEDSARVFLDSFKAFLGTGLSGIESLKRFWQAYVELFGSSNDIFIIFQLRNFLNPGQPFVSHDEQKSPCTSAIIRAMKDIIDQCKDEGVFDPNLDSVKATRLLLSMFSLIVDNASRTRDKRSPAVIDEMKTAFRIIIRGLAKEGIDRHCLDIG